MTATRGGIDLGGTKIQAIVLDDDNRVLGEARRPTPAQDGPRAVVEALAEAMREAAGAAGVETVSLAGVGVGAPGAIRSDEGTVAHSGNLPGFEQPYPLGGELSAALGTPVVLGNDCDVATWSEFRIGAGAPYASVLGVFWGTGIGGGLVLAGSAWRGRGAAGEIGHVVVQRGGARCGCGRRGCLEAYAGRASMEERAHSLAGRGRKTHLFRLQREKGRERLTSGIWAKALEQDDRVAHHVVDRAVGALGAGIASVVNVLDVEAVVIGGGLGTRLGRPYADRILEAMMPHLFVRERPPAVLAATLGDLGGAIGAALQVEDRPAEPR